MADRTGTLSHEVGRDLLDSCWTKVLNEDSSDSLDARIVELIDSPYVAIRYCLPTQILGKLVNPALDARCLQKGNDDSPAAWDPRSFCSRTIAPWVMENQCVLGSSADPYVGKPLRKPFLEASPGNVKGREYWITLYDLLNEIQTRDDPSFTEERFLEVLRCIKAKVSELKFDYVVPERVSLEQTMRLIGDFLSEGSGGDRGLAVAAAIMETIGKEFGLFETVKRGVINAADSMTGSVADLECYSQDGGMKLAVEVKERHLSLADVRQAINRARSISLKEFLFNIPGTKEEDKAEIETLIEKTWASGTNLYRLEITELLKVVLSLSGELGRTDFLRRVGDQLDRYNTQPSNRRTWKTLLDRM